MDFNISSMFQLVKTIQYKPKGAVLRGFCTNQILTSLTCPHVILVQCYPKAILERKKYTRPLSSFISLGFFALVHVNPFS